MRLRTPEKRWLWIRFGEAVVTSLLVGLMLTAAPRTEAVRLHSYHEIKSEGALHVGVLMNPMEYYIHQGKVGGFSYELCQQLCDSLQLKACFHVYYTSEDIHWALLRNDIDLLAAAEVEIPENHAFFAYTRPLFVTDVVCVRHRCPDCDSITDFGMVFTPLFERQAARIKRRYPSWKLHLYSASADQLLEVMEQQGRPDATLVYGFYWRANAALYPHLEAWDTLPGSFPLRWAVRQGNDTLLAAVNAFLQTVAVQKGYARLKRKYTDPQSNERNRFALNVRHTPFGSISRYDDILKKYGAEHGVDWRLLAALIYQESKFRTDVTGRGNTFGLMQFVPSTGSRFGVHAGSTPAQQIEAGCRYVDVLRRKIIRAGVQDSLQRVPMVVAAYNAGGGHLTDAIALAREMEGLDPNRWEGGVTEALLLLGERKYNRLPVVQHGGYHGGRHTIRYVKSVLERTAHYQAVVNRDSLMEIK